MPAKSVYFAAASRANIGTSLVGRLQSLKDGTTGDNSILDNSAEYANALRHYYGKDSGFGLSWGITRGGKAGELARTRINRARAYAQTKLSVVTQAKVTWRPQAKNGDAGAAAGVTLTADIMADLWENKGLSEVWLRWIEQAIVLSQAFVFDEWNRALGPPLGPAGDQMVTQGDIEAHNVLPWDVKVDPACPSPNAVTWRFVRLWKNRWDLAKLWTRGGSQLADGKRGAEAEDAILSASESSAIDEYDTGRGKGSNNDLVPVWYFFHDKTPALPMGRETIFISANCVLRDGRLSYESSPVHRIAAGDMFGTPHAWTSFWDTLGPQEISDSINTSLSTTATTLGNTNLAVEQGSDVKGEVLPNGLRIVRYPRQGKKPEFINPPPLSPDMMKYDELLSSEQRQLSGLDELSTGQFDGKQLNAQAFAVLASLTVQKASPFQTAATAALARLGTSMLRTYKKRVSREREIKVTGKSSKSLYAVQKFSGKSLEAIDGVKIDIGNPLEQTAQGRATILDTLLKIPGAVTSPEAAFEVWETGRLEPALRADRDELLLLKSEYEQLQEGKSPPVHFLQNHPLHFKQNYSALSNPDALNDPEVIKAVNAHLDQHYLEHYGVARGPTPGDPMTGAPPTQGDPLRYQRECFLMGRTPDPSLMPPPMGFWGGPPGMAPPGMGAPPGAPSGAGGPPPGPPGASPPMPPAPEASAEGPPVRPVSLPKNPVTGQQWDPATGGGLAQPQ